MRIYSIIALIAVLICGCNYEQVDLIVHNGKIYTIDGSFSMAEAMAVKDGKILATGSEREILNKYLAENKVDCRKRPVYPGFIDAHCHFLGYGLSLQKIDLTGTSSFKEVLERVQEFAASASTEWITGRGWDQNDWEVKEFPDNSALDSLFPDRPVLLRRVDGHAAIANTEALKRAGITPETEINGGMIEKKNGRLTGILIDNAVDVVLNTIPSPTEDEMRTGLLEAQKNCFEKGLTTVDDAGLTKTEVEVIDKLHKEGQLKMRVYAMLADTKENLEHYLVAGPYKTDLLNIRSFKFYGDGALGSRGALLIEPYEDLRDSNHYGMMINSPEYYHAYAQKLFEHNFQMNTHCIGDSANRLMLNIYADVLGGTNDRRWRIEHAQVVHPDDLEKFKTFNIIPSVQPTHATSDMYWAEERLGPERVKYAYAYKYLMEQNGMIPLGTDFPVEDINPLLTFYAAVARKDLKGWPEDGFQPENALSRKEALMGMTIWPAIANFEELEKGSLEPGKFADFVILEKDIMEVPVNVIPHVKVVATYSNGERVFQQ